MLRDVADDGTGRQRESLIEELEVAVRSGSAETRVEKLRQVSNLFLHDAAHLSDAQVAVFDHVLCRLSERIEQRALVELGERLGPLVNAPLDTIRTLAWHEEAAVAAPVLSQSPRLTTDDLVEIARVRGQEHLAAISRRDGLESAVTDVILARGSQSVLRSLAGNDSARFSEAGMATLVRRSEDDDVLTELVGARSDLPPSMLRDLLAKATAAVRDRILALFSEERRREVSEFLERIARKNARVIENRFAAAEHEVRILHEAGSLDENAIRGMALRRDAELVSAAVALLSGARTAVVFDLLAGPRNDAVLVPCKAAGMHWPTVDIILRQCRRQDDLRIISLARADYERLSRKTAQQALRFLQVKALVN
jgi:uncharacterized protein (DUF2336 family)